MTRFLMLATTWVLAIGCSATQARPLRLAAAAPRSERQEAAPVDAVDAAGAPAASPLSDEVNLAAVPAAALPSRDAPVSATVEVDDDQWTVSVAPFLWAASIKGKTLTKGLNTKLDISFSDILDNLDIAGMAQVEIWHGSYGLLLQTLYLVVSDSGGSPLGEVDVTSRTWMNEIVLAARVYEQDGNRLDLLGGVRTWKLSLGANVQGGPSTKGDVDWVDPILGLRQAIRLDDDWSLSLRGDTGGFNIGNSSQTWQAQGYLAYQASEALQLGLGYRHLVIDYTEGHGINRLDADLALSGPVAGLIYRF